MVSLQIEQLTLINAYTLKDDKPTFFTFVFEHLDDFRCDKIIIGGDYNLVPDVENDGKRRISKTYTQNTVQNPELRRFTWMQRYRETHCRLEFFIVSKRIVSNTINTDIKKKGVLAMMTEPARKTSLKNKHLRNCDYFAIIPSCLHFTMLKKSLQLD